MFEELARAGDRRKGKSEVDGLRSTQGFVGQGKRSGVYPCCNMKLLEGFLQESDRHAVTFLAFPS